MASVFLTIVVASVVIGATAIPAKPDAMKERWGDQGNGKYVNPIIPGDYSDLDAIRVGDDFYAISSTFQFSPGVVILHSNDLVNWTILGHAVNDITQIGPDLNWDRMDRYGRGIWAGAIRYHDKKFWIYFGTPNEGFFMTTATNPAGPWEPLHPVWNAIGWDDCCPFWDDDGPGGPGGQGYFICSNTSGGYKIHLFKMTADGQKLLMDSDVVIHQSKGSEANKLYKINGLYYHYYSEVHSEGRVAMMERSKSLTGPWESRQSNHVDKHIDKEPNQGGLIQLASGDWWFITHQGTGDWEGRAMVLLPVAWVDGWPIIGKVGSDGIGQMVWEAKKPIVDKAIVTPQAGDEFDEKVLGPQWEWNYQPREGKWSLAERPGFLRLHAFKPLKSNDLLKAGDTLTQRAMRTSRNEVTIKLDLSGMADGQQSGLCHFAGGWSSVGVAQEGDLRSMVYNEKGKVTTGPIVKSNDLWIKSTWGYDGDSEYSFSIDGKKFTAFGNHWHLTWGNYRGDRIGIFSFNNKSDNGYVDIDYFHYDYAKPAGLADRGEQRR